MRIKILWFIIISLKNGAKHSSYFRPYYGNDGKSGLRPEFMRLSAISTKWKIFWIVNQKSNVLPSRINLYDILKRKLNENNFKTPRIISDLYIKNRPQQTGYSTTSDFLAAKVQVKCSCNTVAIDQLIDQSINK